MISLSGKVDLVNIGLMILSFILAVKIPFTLLLFSYAILGPLHYLTEIFWLREHQYFIMNRRSAILVLPFCLALMMFFFLFEVKEMRESVFLKTHGNSMVSAVFFIGFVSTVSLTALQKWSHRIMAIAASLLLAIFLRQQGMYQFIFGMMLATIIHVCVFTFLFMVLGTLKSGSFFGYLALLVYIACLLGFAFIHIDPKHYLLTPEVYDKYIKSGFHSVNMSMARTFSGTPLRDYSLLSGISIRIQCFIAFAYTYHYLNWFSKVEIIKWNQVPRKVINITLLIWVASILLYAYDYKAGLLALLLLSLLHVFLEFPLNYRSMTGIAAELRKKFSSAAG